MEKWDRCPRCGYSPGLHELENAHDVMIKSIEDFKKALEKYDIESEEIAQGKHAISKVNNKKLKKKGLKQDETKSRS